MLRALRHPHDPEVGLRDVHPDESTGSSRAAPGTARPRSAATPVHRGLAPPRTGASASVSSVRRGWRPVGHLGELECDLGAEPSSDARSSSSAAMSASSWSRSPSSSRRENLVRRRSRSSRMYSACTSDRSKTSCSRVRAPLGVVGGADDLDDLVDVEDRDEQALDEVQSLAPAGQSVLRAPRDHGDAVPHVDVEQLAEAQGARRPVDERDVVDAEAVLERGVLVELLEHGRRVEAGLDADDEPQPVVPVGQVVDVGDADELLRLDAVLDLLDHALGADQVRQLRDDEPGLPGVRFSTLTFARVRNDPRPVA